MEDSSNTSVDYNAEPVFYCRHCLSLKIMNETHLPDLEYCGNCGSTCIDTTSISEWEEMHKQRYGFKILDKHI